MKLYPFMTVDSVVRNIVRVSRWLGFDVLVSVVEELRCFIVIGDGTPEDEILALIAYHLNSVGKVIGIAKPEFVGIKVFELIPTYLVQKVGSILVLIDQEDYDVEVLIKEVEERLRGHGIAIESRGNKGRLVVYDCERGGRRFRLIVVINGLDEIPFERHMVEDHLLKAAKILLGEQIGDVFSKSRDAKEAWKKLYQYREDIYRKLRNDKKLLETVFPQQVRAMRILEESC